MVKVTQANIWEIGTFRLGFAALAILAFIRLMPGEKFKTLTLKKVLAGALIGVIFGCDWTCFFTALKTASVSTVVFAECGYPLYLVILGAVVFGEKISRAEWGPLALGFSGVLLMLPSLNFHYSETKGFLLAVAASLLFATLSMFHKLFKKLLTDYERSFFQYAFGFLFFLFFWDKTTWDFGLKDWLILVVLAIFCTTLAHTLWGKANAHLLAKTNAMLYFLVPVYSTTIAVVFLDENLSPRIVLGGALVVGGYYWYQTIHSKEAAQHTTAK